MVTEWIQEVWSGLSAKVVCKGAYQFVGKQKHLMDLDYRLQCPISG
jgi:hypothetical protein